MRVLLVKSQSLASKNMGVTPPLGLMYLAAVLQQRLGAEVRIVDLKFITRRRPYLESLLASFRRIYRNAYLRFYSNPSRIYRILRDRPYWADLPLRLKSLIVNNSSFRRLREE